MATTVLPCEMLTAPDHVTVVLRPPIAQSSWTDIEAFGAAVRDELERRKHPVCLVDLSPLTYMGSSVVALIVRMWKVVNAREGRMVVVCQAPPVLEVVRLAGLDKVWTLVPDVDAARHHLGLKSGTGPSHRFSERGGAARSSYRVWYFTLGVVTVLIALAAVLLIVANR